MRERMAHLVPLVVGVLVGVVLLLMCALGFVVVELKTTESRLTGDEATTCVIQNRGLKAQPHLVRVMEDFNTFIQPPKGLKHQAPVPKAYAHALADVRVELPKWLDLVKAQPASRSC